MSARWGLYQRGKIIHFAPEEDERPHEMRSDSIYCPCNPQVEAGNPTLVFHNCFNGREQIEEIAVHKQGE